MLTLLPNYVYISSFSSCLKRSLQVINIDFRQDLMDFWGDGDELNNFQDSSISLLSMKLRKHDSFERLLTTFSDLVTFSKISHVRAGKWHFNNPTFVKFTII